MVKSDISPSAQKKKWTKSGQKVSFSRGSGGTVKIDRGAAFVWFLAQKSQGIDFYNHWCSRVCTQRKQQRAAKSFCCVCRRGFHDFKSRSRPVQFLCGQKLQASLDQSKSCERSMESQRQGPVLCPDSINSFVGSITKWNRLEQDALVQHHTQRRL